MRTAKKRFLSLAAACALAVAPVQFKGFSPEIPAAQAQVPTIDLSSLAKLKEVVGTVNQQLGQLNGIFNTVSQINKVIGAVGSGNIGSILGLVGLGGLGDCLNRAQGLIGGGGFGSGMGSVTGLMSGLSGLTSSCSAAAGLAGIKPTLPNISQFPGLSQVAGFSQQYQAVNQAFQSGGTIGTASSALRQGLYINGGMNPQAVENINQVRGIVARQSAVDAMGVAIQGKTYLEKAPEDIQKLSDKAKEAQNLRDDLAVNNAIMIKILEQLQQQNAQLSSLLQMRSSGFIATDAHTFAPGGSN